MALCDDTLYLRCIQVSCSSGLAFRSVQRLGFEELVSRRGEDDGLELERALKACECLEVK